MRLRQRGIEHHLILNTPKELSLARKVGVRAAHISNNVYCNERVFRRLQLNKVFDALYIAKSARFKRHELAKDIERLAILRSSGEAIADCCPAVAHATTNSEILDKESVARFINQANCTLALSAEEGGMFASFESLLCGVPVVSTPSRGGRDLFYDESNSLIVKATSEDVRAGVEKINQAVMDPAQIRGAAVLRLSELRVTYSNYIAEIIFRRRPDLYPSPEVPFQKIHQRISSLNLDDLFCEATAKEIPEKTVRLLQ
jgi:glycosyltransferase involved in cell wall biosynthesis